MDKTLGDLEWHRIVTAIRERLRGPRADRVELPIAGSQAGARRASSETAELVAMLAEGEILPLDGFRDVDSALDRVEREGALTGPELRDVSSTIGAASVLRRFLGQRRDRMPLMHDAFAVDPSLDNLAEEISDSVEPDGTLSDRASPELRRLRTEIGNLRGRLVKRLEEMIVKRADILSDRFYTLRDGRYVLPLRTDAHEKLPGIVHGTSQSGATVFIEPRQLVSQGNRLRLAQGELEREEARILTLLSDRVHERVPALRAAIDALSHADLRNASARLAEDLEATVPDIVDDARAELRAARHPLLLLDGVSVVPNDISLSAGHGLVLSGPNAGGKTVALKILGLAALMARAGIPFPAEEGSVCGFFEEILTDVGDDQSLERNLSTFSAHVTNLASILERAGPRSLVLLDELAGGTDPGEGAALACAVVETLCDQGAAVALTTHYEPLKALALRDDRLRNASVGFDVDAMAPTFALSLDVPGASSALAVAQRFGVPRAVIERAQAALPENSRTFDQLVRKLTQLASSLEDQKSSVEKQKQTLSQRENDATAKEDALARELSALKKRERDRLGKEANKLLSELQAARQQVRAARKSLRRQQLDEATVGAAKAVVEKAGAVVSEARQDVEPEPRPLPAGVEAVADELTTGVKVWVPHLRAVATVLASPERGKVRVAAGPLKLTVDVEGLRRVDESPPESRPARSTRSDSAAPKREMMSSDNTLDLRGLRVDDAVGMLESFLDQMYGAGEDVAYVTHGVGSGALRDAVRAKLREDAIYVRRHRAGSPDEGGDRVTVVYLK